MTPNEINQNFWKTPGEVFGLKKKSGLFGLELELEGRELPPHAVAPWIVHREHNIRGFEYVTNGPLPYNKVRESVELLQKFLLKENGAVLDKKSYKAGTHIHMNVSNIPFVNIYGVIAVFTIIESVMLRMCGPDRDGNHFCTSSADCGDLPAYLNGQMNGTAKGIFDWHGRGKYAALNIDPVGRRDEKDERPKGSLEFRFFPASLDPNELYKFCTWLFNLRTMVQGCEDKTFMSLLEQARETPYDFARKIIPELDKKLFPVTSVEEGILFGVENSYEILRLLKKYLSTKAGKGEIEKVGLVDAAAQLGVRPKPPFLRAFEQPAQIIIDDLVANEQPRRWAVKPWAR